MSQMQSSFKSVRFFAFICNLFHPLHPLFQVMAALMNCHKRMDDLIEERKYHKALL